VNREPLAAGVAVCRLVTKSHVLRGQIVVALVLGGGTPGGW